MDCSKYKILIVDDEVDLGELCVDSFEMEGFQVKYFSSSVEAMEHLNSNNEVYDVIISDENMPEVSGRDLLKELAQKNKLQNTLFYLSTGDIELKEEEIDGLGGAGLLVKPYDLDETVEKIKTGLLNKVGQI
ncbi:MAG: response regulator [Halobacteriovoraceae bacterium]|nr:response regulator [Halobacteriovoraceae bacterium]